MAVTPVALPELTTGGPLFAAEAALAARLELAFPAEQFTHAVMPARLTKTTWERLTRRLPFVGRGFVRWAPAAGMGRMFRGRADWMMFLATRNPEKGNMLRGDALGVGQLAVGQIAVAVLQGWTVPGLGTWTVGGVENLFSDDWGNEDTALLGVPVSIELAMDLPVAAAALDDFLTLGMTWVLPDLPDPDLNVRSA